MDYFDCDYFDQTYFDTPDCGAPAPVQGGHRVGRVITTVPKLPDEGDDELLAII